MLEAFRRCAAGEPVQRIATWLRGQASEGSWLRAGGINTRYLRDALTNEIYIGVLRAGGQRGKHKRPIIQDMTLWAGVQARLGQRATPSARVGSALGGVVRCWHCRHVLAANWSLSKRHGKRRAYRCRNERCGRWTFALEDDLLPLAEEAFFARVEDIEKQQMATNGKVLRKLEQEHQEIQQGISNLVQLATRRSSRLEAIEEQLSTEQQRLERVERRLARLDSTPALPKPTRLTREWPEMPAEERKRLFLLVFGAIVVQAPAGRRDHSVPLRERIAFLPLAEAASLPRPGRLPKDAPPQHTLLPRAGGWGVLAAESRLPAAGRGGGVQVLARGRARVAAGDRPRPELDLSAAVGVLHGRAGRRASFASAQRAEPRSRPWRYGPR